MDLRVVLLLALLGNITVRQSSVNNAKILNGPIWTKGPVKFFQAVENSTGTVWAKPKSFDYRLLGCEQL